MSLLNQQESVNRLMEQVKAEFDRRFPLEIDGTTFRFIDLNLALPNDSFDVQKELYDKEESLELLLKGTAVVEREGKQISKTRNQILARIPYVNQRGTYIIKGKETVFINRMTLMPGVFINPKKAKDNTEKIEASVRTANQTMKITFDTQAPSLTLDRFTIDYSKKSDNVDVLGVLRILGASEAEIQNAIGNPQLFQKLSQRRTKKADIRGIFSAGTASAYPGDEEALEKIKKFFNEKLTFSTDSQKVNKITLGDSYQSLGKDAILATVRQIMQEERNPKSNVKSDDIRFKTISGTEDLMSEAVGKGIDEWIKNVAIPFTKKPDATTIKIDGSFDNEVKKAVNSNFDESFAEFADVPNPLAQFQTKQKVTMIGKGGVTAEYASLENRNLQDTAFGKIDPIETPQSGKMGLIQHLSKDAVLKKNIVHSSFYRVQKGKVDMSNVVTDIHPIDEYDEFIAFNDPRQVKYENGTYTFTKDTVRVRNQGTFKNVPTAQVTLIDKSPNSVFGYAAALIPFVNHDDGSRALMGANMQSQAMALENPEAPLVQSLSSPESTKTVEEEVADKASFLLRSPVDGVVSAIKPKSIEIKMGDGSIKSVEKLNYFATGKMGGYINHVPVVQIGQKVKSGDLLADGWQSKNGQLALGKNALIAYMPFEGYNFEDGVVISESFANKMASEEIKTYEVSFPESYIINNAEVKEKLRGLRVSDEMLNKLDNRGVIKVGEEIELNDILVGALKPRDVNSESESEKLYNLITGRHRMIKTTKDLVDDKSYRAKGYSKGKVIDVSTVAQGEKVKFVIRVLSYKKMEIGDKIAGRHGNKGVVTKVSPDNEMPKTEQGEVIDLIFSPLAVPSRKNVGQLLEVHAGLISKRKGLGTYKVMNFNPDEVDKVRKGLEEIGAPDGRVTLINPVTKKPYEKQVTIGYMYINKLKHKAESKITARNFQGTIDEIWMRPKKVSGSIDGERTNPQGIGGMEFWSLISGSAVENVHEMNTLKSDGAGDRKARMQIFNAIKKGVALPEPLTPQSFKVVQERLKGVGLNIVPLQNGKPALTDSEFNALMLQPMKKSDWEQLGMSKVENFKSVEGYQKSKDYAKGGFYDEEIFGEDGSKWGKIELVDPIVNPLYMSSQGPRPYEALLNHTGLKQTDIKKIVGAEKLVVLDPKDSGLDKYAIIDVEEYDALDDEEKAPIVDTGNSAIFRLLKESDLKKSYEIAENELLNAKKADQRSKAERHLRILSNALDNGFEPTDYMFSEMPVLPSKYRPRLSSIGTNVVGVDGLTRLYSQFFANEQRYKENIASTNREEVMSDFLKRKAYIETQKQRYKKTKDIFGTEEDPYKDGKGKEYHGILHPFATKFGIFREKMQKKSQDYSGRAVIAGDPKLDLDQVGLPEDMVAVIFEPFIRKELSFLTPERLEKSMKTRDEYFRTAAVNVTKTHPVILNRQPSLHRHSMQAFYPKIRWNDGANPNRTIGLNPLVTTGYNADYDGDTMPVFVPLSEAAKKEAIEKLMPSNNLMNPGDNKIIMELKHEMQLGIYYMTRDIMPTGIPKKYDSLEDLQTAYEKGEVKTYDAVQMNVPYKGMVVSTAGKHLFNLSLPPAAQDYKANVDMTKKKLEKLLHDILYSKKPNMGMFGVRDALNKLKNLSFKVSTYSGMSISMTDFDPVLKKKEELVAEAESKFKNADTTKLPSGYIDAQDALEAAKVEYVKNKLTSMLDDKNPDLLDPDSDMRIMQVSGARAKASQIVAMGGTFGVGKSVTEEKTRAVMNSHVEGLTPFQFWDSAYDSRKGIFDKSIATRDPGALTRKMWMANKQTIIVEKDCGDTKGIYLNMKSDYDKRALHGRVLLSPVVLKKPSNMTIPVTKEPLTKSQTDLIKTNGVANDMVHVRSPLSCKSTQGICQLCYGARAGDALDELVPIGEAIGSIAAQAVGEPSQQAIMRTFHVGAGNASANSFQEIQRVLSAAQELPKQRLAVLAKKDGVISAINKTPDGQTEIKMMDGTIYDLNKKPILEELKIGTTIKAGQLLTKEREEVNGNIVYHTLQNPYEVLRYRGVDETRDMLMLSLNDALQAGSMGGVDKRHLEVMVSNMLGDSKVKDGGTSPFNPGAVVKTNQIQMYNDVADKAKAVKMKLDYANRFNVVGKTLANDHTANGKVIAKKGDIVTQEIWEQLRKNNFDKVYVRPQKASYEPIITNLKDAIEWRSNTNWVESVAGGDIKRRLSGLAALGSVDPLDNPLSRQIAGLKPNFGTGYDVDQFKTQFDNNIVGNLFL